MEKRVMSPYKQYMRLVREGEVIRDKDALRLSDNYGSTIAHAMARRGHKFEDDVDILMLVTRSGCTVAGIMMNKGYTFPPEKVAEMKAYIVSARKNIFDESWTTRRDGIKIG